MQKISQIPFLTFSLKALLLSNGDTISISSIDRIYLQVSNNCWLDLKNVLYTLEVVVNLIYINKLGKDNHRFLEFDPYGFSIMDCNNPRKLRP